MNNSPVSTVILLLNSMIGSGILVQPFVFKESGIISAIVEYLIIGTLTYIGIDLLIRASDTSQKFEYSTLAVAALGEVGAILVDVSIVVGNAGALLSYILIIGSLMESVLSTYVPDTSEWYYSVAFITTTVVVLLVIPLCCIRNFGHLVVASYISITAIGGTVLLVLIEGD